MVAGAAVVVVVGGAVVEVCMSLVVGRADVVVGPAASSDGVAVSGTMETAIIPRTMLAPRIKSPCRLVETFIAGMGLMAPKTPQATPKVATTISRFPMNSISVP